MSSPSARARQSPSPTPARSSRTRSPTSDHPRSVSNARLASPVPTSSRSRRPSQAVENPYSNAAPLAGLDGSAMSRSPGTPRASALASALSASMGRDGPQNGPQNQETDSLHRSDSFTDRQAIGGGYGSFNPGSFRGRKVSGTNSPAPFEDFEVVRRHLAGPAHGADDNCTPLARSPGKQSIQVGAGKTNHADTSEAPDLIDGFSSLRMQGGDVHREIYRRTEAEESAKRRKTQRSYSFDVLRQTLDDEEMNVDEIRQPGGFRRNHILRNTGAATRNQVDGTTGYSSPGMPQSNLLTRNFFEFLSLYGHFAGEAAEYDDEDTESTIDDEGDDHDDSAPPDERRPLLKRTISKRRRKDDRSKAGTGGTVLILLKSFVGTGVLFLPKAFLNGGMVFSVTVLLTVALVSYYCFLLLTTSRNALKHSYAEMGQVAYGRWLRVLINSSLVISQVGFASAYIVFTSENLRSFILAVSKGKTYIDIKLMILMQLVIFLPLSLYRKLGSLHWVAYIADAFIALGIFYLYYYDIATIAENHGAHDITLFNRNDWTLFIGTAIFTFEGIGLIIPIQDGMKDPKKLPKVLGGVMVGIASLFILAGALSYAAFGSKTKTVVITNMRQDNKLVNGLQFMYSLAILLSTPMQIFPAITITENGIFSKSGKYSTRTKWLKNVWRFTMVMICALIAWVGANDLDKFVALVGSFACIPLVYIYPPLIHRKAVTDSRWKAIVDVLLVFFGIILMGYTSVLTIMSWVGSSGEHHTHHRHGQQTLEPR